MATGERKRDDEIDQEIVDAWRRVERGEPPKKPIRRVYVQDLGIKGKIAVTRNEVHEREKERPKQKRFDSGEDIQISLRQKYLAAGGNTNCNLKMEGEI